MSLASSLTGLSSASSFTNFHHGAWCTPPRLFLEDQVNLDCYFASKSVMSLICFLTQGFQTSVIVFFLEMCIMHIKFD